MSIDRADWHYGGDYPEDLPPENGGTHIGLFLAWIIRNGLEGQELREDSADALGRVRARTMTGREFLFEECDEKFWNDDLNEEGLAFTLAYYSGPGGEGYGEYIEDYMQALETETLPSLYHVEDTWENYDKLAPLIDERFAAWKASPKKSRKKTPKKKS